MNNNTNDIDLIERYFESSLTDQETARLRDRLQSEPELRKLFDQEELLVKVIRYEGARNDLQYLRKLERSLAGNERSFIARHWQYFAAAASIALVAVAWFFVPFGNQSPPELYAAYFEPYPNVFEPTLRGSTTTGRRAEAFRAYTDGDYQTAATLFGDLLEENPDPGMLLLLGNANLALDRNEEAKKNFNTLLQDYDDLDMQAKWFLSLCHLKAGEVEKAEALLLQLSYTEVDYAVRAKELLRQVN